MKNRLVTFIQGGRMQNRTFTKEDIELASALSVQLPFEKRISLKAFLYILYIGYKIDTFLARIGLIAPH
jgi:hypothetical protein